jgi:hypothetical protein
MNNFAFLGNCSPCNDGLSSKVTCDSAGKCCVDISLGNKRVVCNNVASLDECLNNPSETYTNGVKDSVVKKGYITRDEIYMGAKNLNNSCVGDKCISNSNIVYTNKLEGLNELKCLNGNYSNYTMMTDPKYKNDPLLGKNFCQWLTENKNCSKISAYNLCPNGNTPILECQTETEKICCPFNNSETKNYETVCEQNNLINKCIGYRSCKKSCIDTPNWIKEALYDPNKPRTDLGYCTCSTNTDCSEGYQCINNSCMKKLDNVALGSISWDTTDKGNNLLECEVLDQGNSVYCNLNMGDPKCCPGSLECRRKTDNELLMPSLDEVKKDNMKSIGFQLELEGPVKKIAWNKLMPNGNKYGGGVLGSLGNVGKGYCVAKNQTDCDSASWTKRYAYKLLTPGMCEQYKYCSNPVERKICTYDSTDYLKSESLSSNVPRSFICKTERDKTNTNYSRYSSGYECGVGSKCVGLYDNKVLMPERSLMINGLYNNIGSTGPIGLGVCTCISDAYCHENGALETGGKGKCVVDRGFIDNNGATINRVCSGVTNGTGSCKSFLKRGVCELVNNVEYESCNYSVNNLTGIKNEGCINENQECSNGACVCSKNTDCRENDGYSCVDGLCKKSIIDCGKKSNTLNYIATEGDNKILWKDNNHANYCDYLISKGCSWSYNDYECTKVNGIKIEECSIYRRNNEENKKDNVSMCCPSNLNISGMSLNKLDVGNSTCSTMVDLGGIKDDNKMVKWKEEICGIYCPAINSSNINHVCDVNYFNLCSKFGCEPDKKCAYNGISYPKINYIDDKNLTINYTNTKKNFNCTQ